MKSNLNYFQRGVAKTRGRGGERKKNVFILVLSPPRPRVFATPR